MELPADDDHRLVVHIPADDASAAALDRLTGRRSGALRAVSGCGPSAGQAHSSR
ncbi:hypothetical protein ACFT8W_24590 [Streptomyces hygroscopicus]|uniref:hypothetical protein n=1 Tax=Streptomyces hygroscopicus TaxID=1912 RepID=UPI003640AE14